jgi:hypothetical protein
MKLTNVILAVLTGLFTIAAIYAIAIGKTHHLITAFIAAFVTLLLIADAKKVKK